MNGNAVDFLRAPRPPILGWLLLCIGLMLLSGAFWLDARWARERDELARFQQQRIEAKRVASMPRPPPQATLAQRRWQQAQLELRRPWLRTLQAIEAATVNPVFLLNMSIDPSKGVIKLEGEAPSFDHALAYVQVLDQDGSLQPASMLSHEQVIDASLGRSTVRFAAVTRWNSP